MKNGQELSLVDRISGFSLKIFGRLARRIAKGMPSLREEILKSYLRTTPDALVSLALLSLVISTAAAAVVVLVSILLNFILLSLAVIAPPIVFVLVLNSAKISQSSRSYAISNELPFMVGYMEVLAGGGVSPISTLRRIANLDKILPASSKEAKLMLVDTDVFGTDPISALEKAANNSPNKAFAEFLYGYTTVLKTGGDAQAYISTKMKEIMDNQTQKVRRSSETIGTMAEAYITVTAVLGISLFTLYQVQAILAHNSAGITNIALFSFVFVPIISMIFVWILDGVGTKQPYMDYRPYKVFAVFAAIGAAVFLIPLPGPIAVHVSIALMATVAVPAFYAIRYSRERRGLEAKLPDFIRDMAEGRKIGLAPESSIEALGDKNYARLTKPVKKMGSQLSWGLSLSKVITTFIASVNSWLTKVIGALMLEVVDVGGGTVRSFSAMADFTSKMNDLESEKRSMLRPYIFVVYMAAVMVVMTTFLMVYFLAETSSLPGGFHVTASIDSGTIDILLASSIFESWVVGFVAGKMGEGSVADGFKHSFVLVLASVVTIYVASTVFNLPA
jgi:flagellar protein FlaJ